MTTTLNLSVIDLDREDRDTLTLRYPPTRVVLSFSNPALRLPELWDACGRVVPRGHSLHNLACLKKTAPELS